MLAHVVHQQNLLQVLFGCRVQHAVHGAQERGPSLVMETDNNTGRGQRLTVLLPKTPVEWKTNAHQSDTFIYFESIRSWVGSADKSWCIF